MKLDGLFEHTHFELPDDLSPEEYESHMQSVQVDVEDKDVLLIIAGTSYKTSSSLSLLEKVKDKNIRVIFIYSEFLGGIADEAEEKHNKASSAILQEYALSGLFKEITLFSNGEIELFLPNLNTLNYYDKINEFIAYVYHLKIACENTRPIKGNLTKKSNTARVTTLGVVDEAFNETLLYSLRYPARKKVYYFNLTEKELKENATLRTDMDKFLKSRKEYAKQMIRYGIFKSSYNFNIGVHYTSVNQEEELNELD